MVWVESPCANAPFTALGPIWSLKTYRDWFDPKPLPRIRVRPLHVRVHERLGLEMGTHSKNWTQPLSPWDSLDSSFFGVHVFVPPVSREKSSYMHHLHCTTSSTSRGHDDSPRLRWPVPPAFHWSGIRKCSFHRETTT